MRILYIISALKANRIGVKCTPERVDKHSQICYDLHKCQISSFVVFSSKNKDFLEVDTTKIEIKIKKEKR